MSDSQRSVEGMMITRFWLGIGLAAALCAGPALGQQVKGRYNADELTEILKGGGGVGGGAAPALAARDPAVIYTSDELAAILGGAPVGTRSLVAGSGVEPGRPGSGVVPDLKVRFGYNSAEVSPEGRAQLDELGRALQTDVLRPYRFQIAGHTDAVGSGQYNQKLSERRAMSVASYLWDRHGVERDRVEAMGFGERQLADSRNPESGVNRRVEVRRLD